MSRFACAIAAAFTLATSIPAFPHGAPSVRVPRALAVEKRLGEPPTGVADLKFADMFMLPVGPKGLEPTARLRTLDGRRVRMVGYVVQQHPPLAGAFMLSPLPVVAGDEDEALADDIPASAMLVRLPHAKGARVPALTGLIQVSGVLHVGAREAGNRVASAYVDLDARPERALLASIKRDRKPAH